MASNQIHAHGIGTGMRYTSVKHRCSAAALILYAVESICAYMF